MATNVNGVNAIGYLCNQSNPTVQGIESQYGSFGEKMTKQDALDILAEIYGQMSIDNNFENAPIVTWLGEVLSRR